jgi:hypothetical protein
MDEEDMYGIPGDYYSHEVFQNYTEYPPTASIDEFREDAFIADNPLDSFGEYMRATIADFFLYNVLCSLWVVGPFF